MPVNCFMNPYYLPGALFFTDRCNYISGPPRFTTGASQ